MNLGESIRALLAEGLCDGDIAERLGVTRNQVIGKRHRMNLACNFAESGKGRRSDLPPPKGRKPLPRKRNRKVTGGPRCGPVTHVEPDGAPPPPPPEPTRPVDIKTPPPPLRIVGAIWHPVMELTEGSCRYPMGGVGSPDFRFCLAPVANGLSDGEIDSRPKVYCEKHHELCNVGFVYRRTATTSARLRIPCARPA